MRGQLGGRGVLPIIAMIIIMIIAGLMGLLPLLSSRYALAEPSEGSAQETCRGTWISGENATMCCTSDYGCYVCTPDSCYWQCVAQECLDAHPQVQRHSEREDISNPRGELTPTQQPVNEVERAVKKHRVRTPSFKAGKLLRDAVE